MIRKYLIPLLSICGFIFAVYYVSAGSKEPPTPKPVAEPSNSTYERFIAGAGIIEANTENIEIGAPLTGIVTGIFVKVGSKVNAGEPLFKLDDREKLAELKVREAELVSAEGRVKEAEANIADLQNQFSVASSLAKKQAGSKFDADRRRFAVETAKARLETAKSEVISSKARLDSVKTELDRLVVKAPVTGEVIKLDIRLGEFVQSNPTSAAIVFGNLDPLHVRVDIDENDAWRFKEGAKAEASLRGNKDFRTDLNFVRVEPYVVPKRSLTGSSVERVDTRVLQVIYSFNRGNIPAFVGQQMDVFIESEK